MMQKKCNWCKKEVNVNDIESVYWTKMKVGGMRFDYCMDCTPGLKVMLASGFTSDSKMVRNIAKRYEMLTNALNEWVASAGGPEYRDRVLLERLDRIESTMAALEEKE